MPTVSEYVGDYLEWLTVEKGRSRATIESYSRDLTQFLAWAVHNDVHLASATTEDLERYVNELRRDKAPSSVARATSAIKGLLGFLVDERVLSTDVGQRLQPSRRGRSLPKALDETVVAHLLDSVDNDDPVARRDRALLELLYGTGARVSEVTSLVIDELDFDEELIRVTGKGSKQRLVPMGRTLQWALRRYLAPGGRPSLTTARPTNRLFLNQRGGPLSRQGVDLILNARALEAGVNRSTVSAHVFRHSCATHMLAHGADIRVVQELLGHASIATTQIYTAVSITSLQRAYESAHPRAHG